MGTSLIEIAHELFEGAWRVLVGHLREGLERLSQRFASPPSLFLDSRQELPSGPKPDSGSGPTGRGMVSRFLGMILSSENRAPVID
jgi:hypothetical protein